MFIMFECPTTTCLRRGRLLYLLIQAVLLVALMPGLASAQELLINGSFESPAAPADGNNFYNAIPNWSVVAQGSTNPNPFNIVKPYSGYCCNQALTTPAGGGSQYFDINSTWGQIRQSFTLSQAGTVQFSGWFSTRDGITALTGSAIYLKDSSGTTLATVTVDFTSADAPGSWKQAISKDIQLAAGTYYFEAYIPDPANFDMASVQLLTNSPLTVSKSSIVLSDPVNGTVNPKAIPGALVRYCIVVSNPAGNPVATAINLSDILPTAQVTFQSGTIRLNASLPTASCDYANGTVGGGESGGVIQATLPDLAGGGFAGIYYDVVTQ